MKQRRRLFCAALMACGLCAVLYAVVPVSARRIDLHADACIGTVDTIEPAAFTIPAGCEAVLCCEGCPTAPLTWRIRVLGDALDRVVLQFENLTAAQARQLDIKGKARWEGTALHVWKGETTVSGFRPDPRSAPPVASPRLLFDRDALRRLQETAATAPGRGPERAEVAVEQLMGKYVVNEARLAYSVRSCPNPPATSDFIDIANNFNDDQAVVLLDARDGSGRCVNDEVFRGNGKIFLGNVPGSGDCNSEAVVFSNNNAMLFVTPVDSWTDSVPDRLNAMLFRLNEARVTVWIATDESGTQERAEWEMRVADLHYDDNNAGIEFNPDFRELFNNQEAVEILGRHCANVSRIKASSFYKAGRLNVYYVDNGVSASWRGLMCNDEPNIIFIDRSSDSESLAHEFGHAFSLNDSNGVSGLDTFNIMWSGGTSRSYFTEGQSFRMNVNSTSKLNLNGARTGPVRDPPCDDTADDQRCPRLSLNVTPK